jgi:DNA oxidative demethylase
MLELDLFAREPQVVAPGAFFIPSWLSLAQQSHLIAQCRQWARAVGGFSVPRMADGTPLSIKSVFLGGDVQQVQTSVCSQAQALAFPPELAQLARQAFDQTMGQSSDQNRDQDFAPDSAMLNWYDQHSTLGMHQDRAEAEEALVRGSPVIAVSLGDSAVFRFGNTVNRNKPFQDVTLRSGDLFVFGGLSRLAYHGIVKVFPQTAPAELGPFPGRLSVTIREMGLGMMNPPRR